MSNDNPAVGGLPEVHLPDGAQHPAAPAAPTAPQVDAPHQFAAPQHAGTAPQAPQGTAPQQFAAPQHPMAPQQAPAAQHAGSAPQGVAPQHAGGQLEAPHQGMEGVHHATPTTQHAAGGEHTVPGHNAAAHTVDHAATGHGAPSHLAPGQHAPTSLDAPHLSGANHATTAQHAGVSAGRGPIGKLRYLRHARPRLHMLIVGGGTAAAVTLGALAVAKAQSDDGPQVSPPTTTIVVTTTTTKPKAPVVTTPAKVPVTAPVTTAPVITEPATTVPVTDAPTTTTVPLLPSGAGSYAVTVGNITINGGGLNASVPGSTETWVFTGACDGVGDCSISAADGEVALTTGAAGSIFSGPGSQIHLVPAGGGSYTSTFDLPIVECGAAVGNIAITVGGGVLTGDYSISFSGASDCPLTSLTATFNGAAN